MISKIILGIMSMILALFIRKPCNAQVSYCTPKETQRIVNQILVTGFHSIKQEGEKNTSFSTYIDSLTNVGLEKLQTAKNIIALKTYSVTLNKKLDNNNYEKHFNDYFYVNDTVVSYFLFEKKDNGEFDDLGEYQCNRDNYLYSYNNGALYTDSMVATILKNRKFRQAALIWFSLDRVQLGLVLVNNGVLYRPEIISQKEEYKFKNKEDEINILNLRYFKE